MIPARKEVFEQIYSRHTWGGGSRSGPGSDATNTISYVRLINHWLDEHPDCKSVIELGCGDWATSRLINFGPDRVYLGVDIVPAVIEANRERFAAANISFLCCDFLSQVPPNGDLLLIKDVLQHLSNNSIQKLLQEVLPHYRYAIITNDSAKCEERRIFGVLVSRRSLAMANVDVPDGDSRPLRLEKGPFNVKITNKFAYSVVLAKKPRTIVYTKEVLIWQRNPTSKAPLGAPPEK